MPATIVRVTIKVDPADAQTVIDAIAECWTELSLEPELLYYDASQSVTDPGTFYQVELWARDVEYLQNVRYTYWQTGSNWSSSGSRCLIIAHRG